MRRFRLLLPLVSAMLLASQASVVGATGPLSTGKVQAVRDYMSATMQELRIPGAAVVIVDKEGIQFAEGFGTTGHGAKPTPQTPFQIASLSKELTAIAVMQRVQAGDLSLDATVHSYLDWFGAAGSDTAKITVQDLLAHASGWTMADGLVNRAQADDDPNALERNVRRLANTPLSHAIGQFEYSNANYDVLGYLVGAVSGQSYEDYMAEHVFGPLAMRHTHTDEAAARADGLAQGFYPFFGVPIPWEIGFRRSGLPSAYIASSAEDLGHVLIAHLDGGSFDGQQVLPAAAIEQLHQPLVHPDAWNGYGWGWWTFPLWDAGKLGLEPGATDTEYSVPIVLEHDGSHDTYAGGMVLLPVQRLGAVILMNTDNSAAPSRISALAPGIADILVGLHPGVPASSDDPVRQYGKALLAVVAVLMALGTAVAFRRLRRWRRDPASGPRGPWGVLLHLVLPLVVDLGVTAFFWWLVLSTANFALADYPIIVHEAPDVGLALAVIAVLGIGWGLIRTLITLRVVRGAPA
jgi:CubicO group peptidase (beta-lactamase class C family)